MLVAEIEVGVYVTPVRATHGRLYEVEEMLPLGKVILRDCEIPVAECRGEYGTLEAAKTQIAKDFRLVKPHVDYAELEGLLAA